MEGSGGIPWIFIHLGWIVLAGVLIYGIWRNRSRRLSAGERAAQQRQVRESFRKDDEAA